jgi:Ser/Thr protein kinase RdoA (MazF antagonist)
VGLEGRVDELGSTQNQNVRLRTAGGDFVLKIANRASTALDMEVGDAAMARLGEADIGFAVPAVAPVEP